VEIITNSSDEFSAMKRKSMLIVFDFLEHKKRKKEKDPLAEYKPNYTPSVPKNDHFKGYKQGKSSKGGYMQHQDMDQMQMNQGIHTGMGQMNEFAPRMNAPPTGNFNKMTSNKRDKKAMEKINEVPAKVNVSLK
jgi:hypothetical protein